MSRERVRLGANYRKLYAATAVSNLGDGMSTVAYPWLASAITRSPVLVALVAAAQRLPWLVFTLPAGVITDRVDRRKAMFVMDATRGCLTLVVAFAVLAEQSGLPAPNQVREVVGTRTGLYLLLVLATMLLGSAEVLRDNCGQTFMPAIVETKHLERANGRLWSIESVTNTFLGPPLGSLLLLGAFALPFFVNSVTFFVAAVLIALIPGSYRARAAELDVAAAGPAQRPSWRDELKEGVRWLWSHHLLRAMAIVLGLMNMASALAAAVFVLYAQDVLGIGPFTFTLMGFGAAIGAIIGGYAAPWLSRTLGAGTCLALTLVAGAVGHVLIGFSSSWVLTGAFLAFLTVLGATWNVITVSLRQTVIPSHLLGRVNSVYRFFGWGMMPIGAVLGGVVVAVSGRFLGSAMSLRMVWFVAGAIYAGLFIVGRRVLTTEALDAARQQATVAQTAATV